MHARVAAFEGDISRIDDLIGMIRERMSTGEEIPGAKRFLMLLDREGGSTLGITFFDSEDSIRAAEPIFDKMGDEVPEELRGRRTSVETYEVVIDDIAAAAGAARVSALAGSPDDIDKGIAFIQRHDRPGGVGSEWLAGNSHPRRPRDGKDEDDHVLGERGAASRQ